MNPILFYFNIGKTKSNMKKISFTEAVQIVIDNFEGGYYHPNMLNDSRGAKWTQATKDILSGDAEGYKPSGETMFGLDRINGKQEVTEAGRKFWKLIDQQDAKNKWGYNYLGGSIAPQLKVLTAEIMQPLFNSHSKKYLSPIARTFVLNDSRLLINFIYAVWNGEGFFKRWSNALNEAVKKGERNVDNLVAIAMNERRKSKAVTIRKSADKMETLFNSLTNKNN